jgi:hypothetical protein
LHTLGHILLYPSLISLVPQAPYIHIWLCHLGPLSPYTVYCSMHIHSYLSPVPSTVTCCPLSRPFPIVLQRLPNGTTHNVPLIVSTPLHKYRLTAPYTHMALCPLCSLRPHTAHCSTHIHSHLSPVSPTDACCSLARLCTLHILLFTTQPYTPFMPLSGAHASTLPSLSVLLSKLRLSFAHHVFKYCSKIFYFFVLGRAV